jgi:hypothetical protein
LRWWPSLHTLTATEAEGDSQVAASRNLYPIYVRLGRSPKKYKAGFIDAGGAIVIQPSFEDARPFREGLASVRINHRWGAINAASKLVIPCDHTIGLDFSNGLAQFEKGPLRGLMALEGHGLGGTTTIASGRLAFQIWGGDYSVWSGPSKHVPSKRTMALSSFRSCYVLARDCLQGP